MSTKKKSDREQMTELKERMNNSQLDAAKKLAEKTKAFAEEIAALREETIPGEIVEQSIDNLLDRCNREVPMWLSHVLKQAAERDKPKNANAETPAPGE